MNAYAAADEVDVGPLAADKLRATQASAFHEQQRGPFVGKSSGPELCELVQARSVNVWLAFRRPADLPRWVKFD
jgi:hypothetical protein